MYAWISDTKYTNVIERITADAAKIVGLYLYKVNSAIPRSPHFD